MKTEAHTILPFPCESSSASRRALRKGFLAALRISGRPVIVDLSDCSTLNHDDIDLLLDCVAHALLVAGSRVNRVLLEVTRISTVVPVFNSVEEAVAHPNSVNSAKEQIAPPPIATENAEDQRTSQFQRLWSA
jgi:hypothetical protein